MTRGSRTLLARAAAPALVLALAGCSGDPDAGTDRSTDDPSSATTSASPSDEPSSDEPSSDDPSGDGGTRVVAVPDSDVAFAIGADWVDLDPEEVFSGGAADNPALEELAERMGMTPRELAETYGSQVDLLLFDDVPVQGFLANINVLQVPTTDLPPDDALRLEYRRIGASVESVTAVDTAVGPARRIAYVLPVQDIEVQGAAVVVDTGARLMTITVSTQDRAESERLADTIAGSLTAQDGTGS